MDSRLLLPVHTVLDGAYSIERVLGSGGFGITYAATDLNLGTTVALKEYYPIDFGDRDATMSVRPKSERHKQTFDWGRLSFLEEARMLARFRHASVVRVSRVFEANATAYMVMDYEDGQNLEAWLTGLGRPPTQEDLDRIAAPLLDALEMMHRENFLHRDIAPDNIVVRTDGSPVLLDFGATRRSVAEMSRTMTAHRQGRLLAAGAVRRRQPPAGSLVRSLRPGRDAISSRDGPAARGSSTARRRRPHAAGGQSHAGQISPGLPRRHRSLSHGQAHRPAAVRRATAADAAWAEARVAPWCHAPGGHTRGGNGSGPRSADRAPCPAGRKAVSGRCRSLTGPVRGHLRRLAIHVLGCRPATAKIEDEASRRQQERHAADAKRERTERLAAEERAEEAKKRTEEARAARERAEAESKRQQEERWPLRRGLQRRDAEPRRREQPETEPKPRSGDSRKKERRPKNGPPESEPTPGVSVREPKTGRLRSARTQSAASRRGSSATSSMTTSPMPTWSTGTIRG